MSGEGKFQWDGVRVALEQHRKIILGIEAAAFLEDGYKLRNQFVSNTNIEHGPQMFRGEQFQALQDYTFDWFGQEKQLAFIQDQNDLLRKAIRRNIHGISHFTKENPQFQRGNSKHTSTPFGYEKPTGQVLADVLQELPIEEIATVLQSPEDYASYWDRLYWLTKDCYADTRRPTNEVSYWDWSYTIAAFSKVLAAKAVLDNAPWTNQALMNSKVRVLGVLVDKQRLFDRSIRVSDMLGVSRELDHAFQEVVDLITWKYPLAAEIYADSTGHYFLFPDVTFDDDTFIQEIRSYFAKDLLPHILYGELFRIGDLDPSNGVEMERSAATCKKLIAEPRKYAREHLNFPYPPDDFWTNEWQAVTGQANVEVCPVCRVRPVGYGGAGNEDSSTSQARDRKLCVVCLDRQVGRCGEWLENINRANPSINQTTIWMNEAVDKHGRIALVIGRFPLDLWLDGTMLGTILTGKTMDEDYTKNPSPARLYQIWQTTKRFWDEIENGYSYSKSGDDISDGLPERVGSVRQRLALPVVNGVQIQGLLPKLTYELVIGGFRLAVVWNGTRLISIDSLDYLAQNLPDEEEISSTSSPLEVVQHYINQNRSAISLEQPTGYGTQTRQMSDFIAIGDVAEYGPGYQPIIPILTEPGTFMVIAPAETALNVVEAIKEKYEREMGKVANRLPLHLSVIYAPHKTPLRAILDAGRRAIRIAEEEENIWMLEDMPLDGCLPEYLNGDVHFETWQKLVLRNNGRKTVIRVPRKMGDGEEGNGGTQDRWYGYQLLSPEDGVENIARAIEILNLLEDEQKLELVPVYKRPQEPTLDVEKKLYYRPSTYNFYWLGSTSDRFEIFRTSNSSQLKPYYLYEFELLEKLWGILAKYLTTSQIHNLGTLIEEKRMEWQPSEAELTKDGMFFQFCFDSLVNAEWSWKSSNEVPPWTDSSDVGKQDWFNWLAEKAAKGFLRDVIEMHMQIMKEKVEG